MTTQRLTKDLRDDIVRRAIGDRFKQREADLAAATTELADAVYEAEYAKHEAVARRLPAGWVRGYKTISVSHPDFTYTRADANRMYNTLEMSRTRLFPNTGTNTTLTRGTPIFRQASALVAQRNALAKDKESLREKLNTIVNSVNTTKQLLELWPEGKAFIPNAQQLTTALVPVGLVADVNAMLGLATA